MRFHRPPPHNWIKRIIVFWGRSLCFLFTYLRLHWAFTAVSWLSLAMGGGGYSSLRSGFSRKPGGFSCYRAWALELWLQKLWLTVSRARSLFFFHHSSQLKFEHFWMCVFRFILLRNTFLLCVFLSFFLFVLVAGVSNILVLSPSIVSDSLQPHGL